MSRFCSISSIQAGKGADQLEHTCRRLWFKTQDEHWAETASKLREQRDRIGFDRSWVERLGVDSPRGVCHR